MTKFYIHYSTEYFQLSNVRLFFKHHGKIRREFETDLVTFYLLLFSDSNLLPWPRYSAFDDLETKFAIRLDDNGTLVDVSANNSTVGKISKRNIYGHPWRSSKDAEETGRKEETYDLPHAFHESLFILSSILPASISYHIFVPELYAENNIIAYFNGEHFPPPAPISGAAYKE